MSTTQLDSAVFEQIVQEVIRRLLDRGVGVMDAVVPAETTTKLEIEDRLVTLETLRDRLDGVGEVVVARRAVVTPAVIDELNDRSIRLMRKGIEN
jgi:hypothetical protein